MEQGWEADTTAELKRRLGKSAAALGNTTGQKGCPDIWELDNGDVAIIGRNVTQQYAGRLPKGVTVRDDEQLVVLPRNMFVAAAPDIAAL